MTDIRTPTLLLVEDDRTNILYARTALQRSGYDVEVARTGKEALSLVAAHSYDMVFMDLVLPDMDGIQITRAIRSMDGAISRVPIVAHTARAMDSDKRASLAAGMNDYLTKPYMMEELVEMVRRHLKKS